CPPPAYFVSERFVPRFFPATIDREPRHVREDRVARVVLPTTRARLPELRRPHAAAPEAPETEVRVVLVLLLRRPGVLRRRQRHEHVLRAQQVRKLGAQPAHLRLQA